MGGETLDLVPYFTTVDLSPFGFDCSCLCAFPCHPAQIVEQLRDMSAREWDGALGYLLTPTWTTHHEGTTMPIVKHETGLVCKLCREDLEPGDEFGCTGPNDAWHTDCLPAYGRSEDGSSSRT